MAGSKDPVGICGIQRGRSHRRAMPEAAIKTVCRFIAEDKFIRESAGYVYMLRMYARVRVCVKPSRSVGVRGVRTASNDLHNRTPGIYTLLRITINMPRVV